MKCQIVEYRVTRGITKGDVFEIDRPVPKPVDEGMLEITADNRFTVWVNGARLGSGEDWSRVYRFDCKTHLRHGKNCIAVQATNDGGPAGLLVRVGFIPNGMSKHATVSDGSWKASRSPAQGWQRPNFNDKDWMPVKVIGEYGKAGPWRNLVWGEGNGGNERFTVPAGFLVEEAVKNVFDQYLKAGAFKNVVEFFEAGNTLETGDLLAGVELLERISGIRDFARQVAARSRELEPDLASGPFASELAASLAELILEGLHCHNRVNKRGKAGAATYGIA